MALPQPSGRVDLAAAVALVGFSTWALLDAYTKRAPGLDDLRAGAAGSSTHQQLLDADLTVGTFGVVSGLAASLIARSWLPLVVVTVGLVVVIGAHHAVLHGAPAGAAED